MPATQDSALRRASRRALGEPAFLLSVAYFAMSALGLWASYWLYRPFGIPIFQYLQPTDILVAGLRDPMYLVLVAAGFALSAIIRRWERWRFAHPDRAERMRAHWYGRLWAPRWWERINASTFTRALFSIGFVIYFAFALVISYTRMQADRILRGDATHVVITYADGTAATAGPAILVGTTAGWVFVFWPQQKRAEAIAQQSLRSLQYPAIDPGNRKH
ncbi:MAG: hypothetical protein ABIR62_11870 [Dokdonella sp.]|uniref:hypothetical protein n=1 Tax=Dokdonella sp. TaxID=2291710 RepID=UPI003267A599